jgi:SP family myo-inositol transporter-like MFS transporter 13
MVVPMYLAETASSGQRGMLVTMNVMFITGGQAMAAVFSGALSTIPDGWR